MQAVQESAEAAMSLAKEQGFPYWMAFGALLRGWALVRRARPEDRADAPGVAGLSGDRISITPAMFSRAARKAYGIPGEPETGLAVLTEALTLIDTTGERWYEPELYRLKGVPPLLQQNSAHQAERNLLPSRPGYRSPSTSQVSRITSCHSLARLWQQQGKREEARRVLGDVYGLVHRRV